MSFSHPQVRRLLAAFFVCTWKDIEDDPHAKSSPRIETGGGTLALPRGSGFANLQILVLTSDGRLLHALSGHIGGPALAWELTQALITHERMQAKPRVARRVVAHRQDGIQAQYERDKPVAASVRTFGIGLSSKTARPGPSTLARRHVRRDRAITKRHPLARVEAVRAAWFVRDRSGGGFAGNQIIEVTGPMKGHGPRETPPPTPWGEMSRELRGRYARALGVAPPMAGSPGRRP